MIRDKYSYNTTFMNQDYTLNGYDASPDKVLEQTWVRDRLYNTPMHDSSDKLCAMIEYLLVQISILHSKIEEQGKLTGMLASLMRESPKPSWLMHPDPAIRELFTSSPKEFEDTIKVLYGVKAPTPYG